MSTESIDATLLIIAPWASSVAQATRYATIEIATALTSFGCAQRDIAIAYLSAHMLSLASAGRNGAAGQVTSEAEGDLSRSYGSVGGTTTDPYYAQTSYGLQYQQMMKSNILTPITRQWTGDGC